MVARHHGQTVVATSTKTFCPSLNICPVALKGANLSWPVCRVEPGCYVKAIRNVKSRCGDRCQENRTKSIKLVTGVNTELEQRCDESAVVLSRFHRARSLPIIIPLAVKARRICEEVGRREEGVIEGSNLVGG